LFILSKSILNLVSPSGWETEFNSNLQQTNEWSVIIPSSERLLSEMYAS
jgi:hypothetical protein